LVKKKEEKITFKSLGVHQHMLSAFVTFLFSTRAFVCTAAFFPSEITFGGTKPFSYTVALNRCFIMLGVSFDKYF